MTAPHRIAVVGIDGSGKSEFIARLRQLAPADERWIALSCPDFHHTPNGPLHELSRQLKAVSDAADTVGYPAVKAAALYLRMTLYGPVEDFFRTTFDPNVLVCERHPLIETLVYAPLYARIARSERDDPDRLAELLALADQRQPGAAAAVRAWQRTESARVHLGANLRTTLGEIVTVLSHTTSDALNRFATAYRTTLPDTVLWLDTPPDQAARRCAARGAIETHESLTHLTALRGNYLRTIDDLRNLFPQMAFHRIENADGDSLDEIARRALHLCARWDGAAGGEQVVAGVQ
ncbi:hypothetical protein ACFVUS_00910 [Nocardia sp. NPDC058058]|uniref:hypothetical protein n=1 Tax=Nocardia sp. NPDC058058 TaxID=3346317 RepID=UPI0036DDED62